MADHSIVSLLIFEKPIYDAINSVSTQISSGDASIEIANLKITLSKTNIPPPPENVKKVLTELDPKMIDFLMANVGENNTLDICYHDANPDELNENSVSNRLRNLNMITFEKEAWHETDGTPCAIGSRTKYTALYDSVRKYLGDVPEGDNLHKAMMCSGNGIKCRPQYRQIGLRRGLCRSRLRTPLTLRVTWAVTLKTPSPAPRRSKSAHAA